MPSIQLCNDLHGSNFSSIMIYMVVTQFNATQFAISRVILTYSFWQCLKIKDSNSLKLLKHPFQNL